MKTERENSISHVISYPYLLPDGLKCSWYYASSDFDTLKSVGEESIRLLGRPENQIRICADSARNIARLGKHLKSEYPDLNINWGKTTYFEYPLAQKPLLTWEDFALDYQFFRVTHHMDYESQIFLEFMLGSFGTTAGKRQHILGNFPHSIRDMSNNFYLVKQGELFLGGFVTKYLPALQEIQLHCVAGRGGDDPRISQEHPKLPVLMAAVLQSIEDDYPNSDTGPDNFTVVYSAPTKLTFSASGAANLYRQLGFKQSQREGLVINTD